MNRRPRSLLTQALIDALGLVLTLAGLIALFVGLWALNP